MKTRAAVWTMLAAAGTLIGAAGCTETSCGGVGFSGGVSVDLAAVHQQHPGVLTVKLCIDGNCNSGSLPAAENIWTGSSDSVKARNIEVTVTDARGKEIFANGLLAKPTKVVFNPGQCDEQTGHSNIVVAGIDGALTATAVTETVVTGP